MLDKNTLSYERLELDLTTAVFGISAKRGTCGESSSVGVDNITICRDTEDNLGGRKAGGCPSIVGAYGILIGL